MLVLVLFLCCIILSVELVTMVFSETKDTLLPMAEEVLQRTAHCLPKRHKAIKVAMYKFLSIMKNWGPLPANQGAVKLQK